MGTKTVTEAGPVAGFYVVRNQAGRVTLAGPFTEAEAIRVNYFAKPVEARDAACRTGRAAGLRAHLLCGVSEYDRNELVAMTAGPEEFGYKTVVIRPTLRMHASWKAFAADFRLDLFRTDSGE